MKWGLVGVTMLRFAFVETLQHVFEAFLLVLVGSYLMQGRRECKMMMEIDG
jgi:hypothetical protein